MKSSASGTDNCVEVATVGQAVHVRDSNNPLGSVLSFTTAEWTAFLAGVYRGEFGRPDDPD